MLRPINVLQVYVCKNLEHVEYAARKKDNRLYLIDAFRLKYPCIFNGAKKY